MVRVGFTMHTRSHFIKIPILSLCPSNATRVERKLQALVGVRNWDARNGCTNTIDAVDTRGNRAVSIVRFKIGNIGVPRVVHFRDRIISSTDRMLL